MHILSTSKTQGYQKLKLQLKILRITKNAEIEKKFS